MDKHQHAHSHACGSSACGSSPPAAQPPARAEDTAGLQRFHIANMDCGAEEAEIRHALGGINGLSQLRFDLSQRTLALAAEPAPLAAALHAMRRIGYDPKPLNEDASQGSATPACPV